MGVGMPQAILLHEFGSHVWSAFGHIPYHVGSSLTRKRGWRDVDVRLILPDEEYTVMGLGKPSGVGQMRNAKWVALCRAFSALGKQITGLPIDFQIQSQTQANENYSGPRSALCLHPLREEKGPYAHLQVCSDAANGKSATVVNENDGDWRDDLHHERIRPGWF